MAFKDEEIETVIEEAKRLPVTHRKSFENHTNDVALGPDGLPAHVPTPATPNERFD